MIEGELVIRINPKTLATMAKPDLLMLWEALGIIVRYSGPGPDAGAVDGVKPHTPAGRLPVAVDPGLENGTAAGSVAAPDDAIGVLRGQLWVYLKAHGPLLAGELQKAASRHQWIGPEAGVQKVVGAMRESLMFKCDLQTGRWEHVAR